MCYKSQEERTDYEMTAGQTKHKIKHIHTGKELPNDYAVADNDDDDDYNDANDKHDDRWH